MHVGRVMRLSEMEEILINIAEPPCRLRNIFEGFSVILS